MFKGPRKRLCLCFSEGWRERKRLRCTERERAKAAFEVRMFQVIFVSFPAFEQKETLLCQAPEKK